jgi:homoserine kinase
MLQVGLNKIRDLHADNIDKAWMGTDGTAVAESQTGLQAGESDTKIAVTVDNSAVKTNVIQYTLPSTLGVGETYREFAVILDGIVEYNRTVFTGLEHTANDDIVVRQTFFYRNP